MTMDFLTKEQIHYVSTLVTKRLDMGRRGNYATVRGEILKLGHTVL